MKSPHETENGWPARTRAEVESLLCGPGAGFFEIEERTFCGVPFRSWKHAPPSLRALLETSRAHPEREFLVYEGERVTYGAFVRAVAALGAHLIACGVRKGDRVAIAMRNLPEWPAAFFAAVSVGAIAVPLNAWWTGPELAYALGDCSARVLICDPDRWRRIAPFRIDLPFERVITVGGESSSQESVGGAVEALERVIGSARIWADLPERPLSDVEIRPDDDATIFYTSGTTGRPKGALGTHRNALCAPMTSVYVTVAAALRRGEPPPEPAPLTILLAAPLFHVTACHAVLLSAVLTGSRIVLMRRWDPGAALALIERERVDVAGHVPTFVQQLLEHQDAHRFDLSSLKVVPYGGAPSAPELARAVSQRFGAAPGTGWGMTETSATVITHTAEEFLSRPDSCGAAVPVAQLRIMADDGAREAHLGEVGELWVKGPMIARGYWNCPEATAATFVDGWLRTGDLARIDADGFCVIVDRLKDMVIRGGENVYCMEVEHALCAYPGVREAAVFGLPCAALGETPVAVLCLAPGKEVTIADIRRFLSERLAAFKTPSAFAFTDEPLPRNPNGKVLKRELKGLFAAAP
jgi:long-chain acyl-CoA synthetase